MALICAAMQVWDYTFMVTDIEKSDGYEEMLDADDIEEAKAELAAEDAVRLWQAGMDTGLSDEEQKAIEKSIFN